MRDGKPGTLTPDNQALALNPNIMKQTKSAFLLPVFCVLFAFLQTLSNPIFAQSALEEAPPLEQKQEQSLDGQDEAPEAQTPDAEQSDDEMSDKKADQGKDSDLKSDENSENLFEEDEQGNTQDDEADDEDPKKLNENRIKRPEVSSSGRYSKNAKNVLALFAPVVASASESTVIVMDGKRQIAMGTIVGSDGLILTKASELNGDLNCKLSNGETHPAVVFGVDPATDLALLKIDAKDLAIARWSDQPSPQTGRWLATPNNTSEPIAIGIVGVDERKIPPSKAFLGIQMLETDDNTGVRINRVISGTPADRYGLLVNDIIFKIDETDIPDRTTLFDALAQYSAGDIAVLSVRRGTKNMQFSLALADAQNASPEFDRANQQNRMGSTPSKRRKDFPLAFQHDSMLEANYCGGPVVDLDGRVVGINIAREGRVASLALPQSVVLPVIRQLMTGEYAPAHVNAAKIEKVNQALVDINNKLESLPLLSRELDQKLKVSQAREEELNRTLKDIESRLSAIKEKADKQRAEFDDLTAQLKRAKSAKRRLTKEREKLMTGSN